MSSYIGVIFVLILVSGGQQSLWKMNIAAAYEIPVLIDLGWLCDPLRESLGQSDLLSIYKSKGHEGCPLFVKNQPGYIYWTV